MARVASRAFAAENSTYRRGPPLRPAMSGRRLGGVEIAGDLAQALAFRVLCVNATHKLVWDRGRSSRRRRLITPSSGPTSLFHKPLKLVDRNEPRPPWHLQHLEHRQHPPVEGRAAHPERLGGLRPCVGESLDVRRPTYGTRRGARGRVRVTLPPPPAPGHAYKRTQTVTRIAPMVHLCLACYRGE